MQYAIDCHCHIYPDKVAERATEGIGSFYGLKTIGNGTLEDMIQAEKKVKITHCVVFSVATTPHQVHSINTFISQSVKNSGGALTGLGTVHPDGDIDGDIAEVIENGLCGIKIHPDIQGFKIDDYRCLKIYEKCEGKLPVLIHMGDKRSDYSSPERLAPILEIFPRITVIGAHLGGWSMWEEAAEKLCGYKNLYVDSSSSLYAMSPEKAKSIILKYGTDKVIFGTDYPMWSPAEELLRFYSLGLSEDDCEKILWRNAKKLFNINFEKNCQNILTNE